MAKRYTSRPGVVSIHCRTVASGSFNNSGWNHDVACCHLAISNCTRCRRALMVLLR